MSAYLWEQYADIWLEDAPDLSDRPRGVEQAMFRGVMAAFPTGVGVISTADGDGAPRGMTANAISSISARPPLLMVALTLHSRTLAAIERLDAFAVNVLAGTGAHLSGHFARPDASFADISWEPSQVARGVPVLTEHVTAVAECRVDRILGAGDHAIVLGRIVGGRLRDEPPLVYHRRGYAAWTHLPEATIAAPSPQKAENV